MAEGPQSHPFDRGDGAVFQGASGRIRHRRNRHHRRVIAVAGRAYRGFTRINADGDRVIYKGFDWRWNEKDFGIVYSRGGNADLRFGRTRRGPDAANTGTAVTAEENAGGPAGAKEICAPTDVYRRDLGRAVRRVARRGDEKGEREFEGQLRERLRTA